MTLVELMIAVTLSAGIIASLATSWWLIAGFMDRSDRLHSTRRPTEDILRLHRLLGAASNPGTGATDPSNGVRLISEPGGAGQVLTAWIDAGPLDAGNAVTDPCRIEIRTGSYDGILLRLQLFAIDASPDIPSREISEHFLKAMGPQAMAILGADDHWYREWPLPDVRGWPRAVRFESDVTPAAFISLGAGQHFAGGRFGIDRSGDSP